MNEMPKVEEKPAKKTKKKRDCVAYGQLLNTITQEEYNPVDIKKEMYSQYEKPFLSIALNQ